jgi:hypothetical protein
MNFKLTEMRSIAALLADVITSDSWLPLIYMDRKTLK